MTSFQYQNRQLCAEDVSLSQIATSIGTPVYVYSAATLIDNFTAYTSAASGLDHLIAYSVKANSNLAVLSLLAKAGAGADVVSGGELVRALRSGIDPQKIVFSGVGKTQEEMRAALKAGIYQFNIESVPELLSLNSVALDMGKIAPIALRINPDVDAGGHEKISTGKAENKFGIDIRLARDVYTTILDLPGIAVQGVDMHIGSQIETLAPFEMAMDKILDLIMTLRADGHNISTYDVGGGLGIGYDKSMADHPPSPIEYGKMVTGKLQAHQLKVIFEPGRSIAGNAGVLLSKIQYIKSGGARTFLILDAAMNDFIRPSLYGAHHGVDPVDEGASGETVDYDIVGPVCETGDTFATLRTMPKMAQGQLVAIGQAGAYGAVQACEYNTRALVPEVLVSGNRFDIIRKRPSIDEILQAETVPDWI